MLTDYHCHLLPAIDDGAKDVDTTIKMLEMLKAQGVERVIATPHFYSHMESVESFLNRRWNAFDALADVSGGISIMTSAEIYLEKGISEMDSLRELTMGESKHVLLELPYGRFKEWMLTEIYQTAYNWDLIPVIAHIERYLQWYAKEDMERVLSIQDAVLQINNSALFKRATQKFVLELIRGGFSILFGSDAHNLDDRPPNVEAAQKVLRAKLQKSELLALTELNEGLI